MSKEKLNKLSREELEKLTITALNKEHKQTYRVKELEDRINKAINKLYEWGEILHPEFQQEMLKILKGEDSNGFMD